jgi:hypothetical protein
MSKPSGQRATSGKNDTSGRSKRGALPFKGLIFVDQPAEWQQPGARLVRIPGGVRSKRKLLGLLAGELEFPAYFGGNWDALEECLCDLSWLPANQPIALIHEDLPLRPRSSNRATYVKLLAACADWTSGQQHEIRVVFPTASQADVRASLSDEPAD